MPSTSSQINPNIPSACQYRSSACWAIDGTYPVPYRCMCPSVGYSLPWPQHMPWPWPSLSSSGPTLIPDDPPKSPWISPKNMEWRVETYPSPLSGQQTPKTTNKDHGVPHQSCWAIPGRVLTAQIKDTPLQKGPHYGIIGTLLRTVKRLQDTVHHQCLMPQLVIEHCPRYPMVIPSLTHHGQVHPLWKAPLDSSRRISMVQSHLLIRWVVLPITGAHVEASVLPRNMMPHGAFKGARIDERHCE